MRLPAAILLFAPVQGMTATALPSHTLANGLTIVSLSAKPAPLFKAILRIEWDPGMSIQERQAVASTLNAAWEIAGFGPWTAFACRRNQAELGIHLQFRATQEGLTWTLRAPDTEQDAAMEHLAHAVLRPRWEGPDVEALGIRSYEAIRGLGPEGRSRLAFQRAMGDPSTPLSADQVADLTLDHLQLLHRRHVRASLGVLVLQGLAETSHARELAILHLGTWSPTASPNVPSRAPAPKTARCFASSGRSTEVGVLLGIPDMPRDPLPLAARTLLGSILKARLEGSAALNGWSFQLPSAPMDAGPLLLRSPEGPQPAKTCMEALREMLILRKAPVTREELERARIFWRGAWAALPLHPVDHAAILARLKAGRLEPEALLDSVESLTPERLTEALEAWLAPEHFCGLLLGVDPRGVPDPRKAIESLGLGPVVVEDPG